MDDPVFLFPGQGSQQVGMGKDLWEAHGSVKELFEEASESAGMDLKAMCFEAPAQTLVQTDNVQPAITVVNLAWLRVLEGDGITPAAVAGHSLGEYAALCAAQVFTVAETMELVSARGRLMHEAAGRTEGGMTAVFGLDMETLSGLCEEIDPPGSVQVANYNSPTQVVLTGEKDALKQVAGRAKEAGAKLSIPLRVSGPWHSPFMAEARDRMREVLEGSQPKAPTIPVISNVGAEPYPSDPDRIRAHLVDQIVSPVLWYPSISLLRSQGHSTFVEVGPGKVLTGLMKDIDPDAERLNVNDPESLERLRAPRS
jgi:[acyl-carrier-protein] S-malonyltransferase